MICRPEPGTPYCNLLWCNKAATERYGPALTQEQRVKVVENYPPALVQICTALMTKLHEDIVVSIMPLFLAVLSPCTCPPGLGALGTSCTVISARA